MEESVSSEENSAEVSIVVGKSTSTTVLQIFASAAAPPMEQVYFHHLQSSKPKTQENKRDKHCSWGEKSHQKVADVKCLRSVSAWSLLTAAVL